MSTGYLIRIITVITLFFCLPYCSLATSGGPVKHCDIHIVQLMLSDTTAPVTAKTTPGATPDKPVETVIKSVPKVRKQAVPVPVNVQVKPIITLKPRIIKPVIKIIH